MKWWRSELNGDGDGENKGYWRGLGDGGASCGSLRLVLDGT